jgi:hypothetical protein
VERIGHTPELIKKGLSVQERMCLGLTLAPANAKWRMADTYDAFHPAISTIWPAAPESRFRKAELPDGGKQRAMACSTGSARLFNTAKI